MATAEVNSARQHDLNRKPLRLMIVEDSAADAELIERQLTRAGYDVTALRVESAAAFAEALASGSWDVIVADYAIPSFGAMPALDQLKQSGCDIPFIVVSGVVTEEVAVSSMRAGAHDYVLKDKIARLVPAIEREMKEASTRRQKREAEAALRHLSAIVESSEDAILGLTLDGTIASWNRGAEQLYGYAAAEMLGRSMSLLVPPESLNDFTGILRRSAAGESVRQHETRRQRKDGTSMDVAVTISPILDSTGKLIGISSIARDVTKRKQREAEISELNDTLRQRNAELDAERARWRGVVEGIADEVWVCDALGTISLMNLSTLTPMGFQEFKGRSVQEVLHEVEILNIDGRPRAPEEAPLLRSLRGDICRGEEIMRHRRMGITRFRQFSSAPVRNAAGGITGAVAIVRDVTDHREAVQALRRSEQRLRRFYDSGIVGVFYWKSDGAVMEANKRFLAMAGYTLADVRAGQLHWFRMTPPECHQVDQRYLTELKITGIQPPRERELIRKDGTRFPVIVGAATLDDADYDGVAFVLDNTERKRAEEAIERSARHTRRVLNSLTALVGVLSLDGTLLEVNKVALAVAGVAAEQVIGKPFWETPWWRYDSGVQQHLREAITRAAQGDVVRYDVAHPTSEGAMVTVDFTLTPMRDEQGQITHLIASAVDITARKQAEQALVRTEKLASVGRMAATIAHEINNPLASAMNALFLASVDERLSESARKNLALAEAELERVAQITKQTLGFYRETGKPNSVYVPDVLNGVLDLYGPKLKIKSVSVQRRFRSTAPVQAVEGELRQVVSNVIANSIDALGAEGTLHVRTSGPGRANERPMLRLTIADNGSGIRPENLKRIFEPFFTTKEAIGTGLGLWVTTELVRKHAGQIRVRSRFGKGTVVAIWLPTERRHQERDAGVEK